MRSWLWLIVTLPVTLSVIDSASAQVVPLKACEQLGIGRYIVLVNQSSAVVQLPYYLTIPASPCSYLSQPITFFGNFNNLDASAFRVEQLRRSGLDAIAHSFTSGVQIPANLAGASVIVEPLSTNPNLTLQQVAFFSKANALSTNPQPASFNNRQVILVAPLVNGQTATGLSTSLRNRGFVAASVEPKAVRLLNTNAFPPITPLPAPLPPTPIPSPTPINIPGGKFRLLVPVVSNTTLPKLKQEFSDVVPRLYQRKRYAQVASYRDQQNANLERDRILSRFPGAIVIAE